MKKLFLILAIGSFAACNGSSSTDTKVDSTAVELQKIQCYCYSRFNARQKLILLQLLQRTA